MSKQFPKTYYAWQLNTALPLTITCLIAFFPISIFAQIIPDNTLGKENSQVTPHIIYNDVEIKRIDGGAIRNTNLFHSFREFNIGNLEQVYFANPQGINNIFSRVTGNNLSEINGKLGVLGHANLFFLNPNGIIFGKNASLDIGGSFLASTADSFVFTPELAFSASNPQATPLLKISVPVGLQYGSQISDSAIVNTGNLSVGKDLILDGDNLNLTGKLIAGQNLQLQAREQIQIRDEVNNPSVAAAGENLLIQAPNIDIFALNHPESGLIAGADLILRSDNQVGGDAHFWSGGNFRIERLDNSLGKLYSPHDPIIRSQGDVNFDSYQGSSLHILAGGSVNIPGNIIVADTDNSDTLVEKITLSDDTTILVDGSARPTVDIRAGTNAIELPSIQGDNGLFSELPDLDTTATTADITIGGIFTDQANGLVLITNQYEPNLNLAGGAIKVQRIFTDDTFFVGDAGDIMIDSRENIILTDDAFIISDSFSGDAGDITLIAQDTILLNRAAVNNDNLVGDGGDIRIKTQQLILQNRGQITTLVNGTKAGGNITIDADTILLQDRFSVISAIGLEESSGNSGNLNINTRSLQVLDGSQISVSTRANGNAGNLVINASELVEVVGRSDDGAISSSIAAQANPGSTGEAGSLTINTKKLSIREGGRVGVSAFSTGDAGNLVINASDLVEVIGISADGQRGSRLEASTGSRDLADAGADLTGAGGDLQINTKNLRVTDGGIISANTFGAGDGGKVTINAIESIRVSGSGILDGEKVFSEITVQANRGSTAKAGDLEIETQKLFVEDGAFISASSFGLIGGNIKISTELLNLNNGLLSTSTASDTGGNFDLQIDNLLLLRNGSQISTNAGTAEAGGDGGNIKLNSRFILAFPQEDSNITANAFEGQGGNIDITTQGIFGINFQPEETPLSDITASSEFGIDGVVSINTPEIDPAQGLIQLPSNFVDATSLIASGCSGEGSSTYSKSEFLILGRGGLPTNPIDPLTSDTIWYDIEPPNVLDNQNITKDSQAINLPSNNNIIVEAQGWTTKPDGRVILTARLPVKNSQNNSFKGLCFF